MRWLLSVLLLVVSGDIRAEEFFLIPENNPKPVYPVALQRTGIVGDVKVRFVVKADGSVSKVSIVQSDHPDLAEATRVAITQWRFRPWVVEDGRPAEQEVVAPMMFRYDSDLPLHTNQLLNELKCQDLIESIAHAPEQVWLDSAAFHYTRAYLTNAFSRAMLSDEQRLDLIAKLNRKVIGIVSQCRNNPQSRFAGLLPDEIRKLL
ncbi:energy transducer TonB [Pseudomonas vancouverensis]|uniref:Protein TonB n=1 Tax=Pseudomonas vancouverensis TaxID=95300 RepID=A0A1H2PEL8_PSEVA|nr:energy transducer TonB [Pseudomonas vancouverensis]KAB0497704.1 energy transducer TonB [Pseudomonas vancouverensis]TDB66431.1 energy transducer TonB [Pseudomonas vancouverensis]SDV16159.1 TonB family C-terminal domain-containing protein [Pseudomonas vancouverensis]